MSKEIDLTIQPDPAISERQTTPVPAPFELTLPNQTLLTRRRLLRNTFIGAASVFTAPFITSCAPPPSPPTAEPAPPVDPPATATATAVDSRVIDTSARAPLGAETPRYLRDIVPAERLWNEYNTQVLDANASPTDFVKLLIRKGALTEPPFTHLQNSPDTLTIVLINGPIIHPHYLLPNQKASFPAIEKIMKESTHLLIEANRQRMLQERAVELTTYYLRLDEVDKKFQRGELSADAYEVAKVSLNYRYERFFNPSDEVLLRYTAGAFDRRRNSQGGYDKFVFLPVRDHPPVEIRRGNASETIRQVPRFPASSHSFPNPNTFKIDPTQPNYPLIAGHTPGINFRHEMLHVAGVEHPYTDYNTVEDLQEAWTDMKEYGDMSKFFYVFHTAPFNYIVTDRPSAFFSG